MSDSFFIIWFNGMSVLIDLPPCYTTIFMHLASIGCLACS